MNSAQTVPVQKPGTDSPIPTVNGKGRGNGHPQGFQGVGDVLSDAELIRHVQDCGWHMECAYARFQAHGDPSDRDAALLWLSMQQEAQRSLSPAAKAVREAEIQRAIDDGVGYFAAAGQRDRYALERRAA